MRSSVGLPAPDVLFLGLCTEGVLFPLSGRLQGKVLGGATKGLASPPDPLRAESTGGVLLWLECLLASSAMPKALWGWTPVL